MRAEINTELKILQIKHNHTVLLEESYDGLQSSISFTLNSMGDLIILEKDEETDNFIVLLRTFKDRRLKTDIR